MLKKIFQYLKVSTWGHLQKPYCLQWTRQSSDGGNITIYYFAKHSNPDIERLVALVPNHVTVEAERWIGEWTLLYIEQEEDKYGDYSAITFNFMSGTEPKCSTNNGH